MSSAITIFWENFHFMRPYFLWFLLPIVLTLILGLLRMNDEIKWQKVIAPHLRSYMIKKGSTAIKARMQVLLFLFLSLATLGAAGPAWEKVETPGKTLETPLVILLDLSQSMMATDIQPNRLERAKFKISDLLEAKPGARIALVGYAGTAHTVIPLTPDYKIIKSHLSGLSPGIMPLAGSNLEAALALADTLTSVTSAPATLLLISDDFSEESFSLLQSYVNKNNCNLEILAMNTPLGAVVPTPEGSKALRNKKGEPIHSSLNSVIIQKLASLERVNINALTLDNSDMEALAKSVRSNLEFKEQDETKDNDWQDKGLYLLIPFALFILMWFRKGWVIYFAVCTVGFSSCNQELTFADLWLSKDYQAQQLYNSSRYVEAAQLYSSEIHKGVAFYKAGNFNEAIRHFSKDTTANGAYNLGLAYYKKGDIASAALAFGKAAEMDPELKDALKNKNTMQQLMGGENEMNADKVQDTQELQEVDNVDNTDPEDLGGGGQEATDEDMDKERKEETVSTDMRKGKEMEEISDNFESGKRDDGQKILMRKVDDDPAVFLKRKFAYQLKKQQVQAKNNEVTW